MSNANSFSALLRRSKLSSYNPTIDQIYTTTPSQLSRSAFGLKRPLAHSKTARAPYVRVTRLDNAQKRTEYRKGTREVKYVKKWQELAVGLNAESSDTLASGTRNHKIASAFVPGQGEGSLHVIESVKNGEDTRPVPGLKSPNIFAMEEEEFERFLSTLEGRREEFRTFVTAATKNKPDGADLDSIDLYRHAQKPSADLNSLLQRFLATTTIIPPSAFRPIPSIHPNLSLLYSSPTLLESALAPPVPGRLLAAAGPNSRTSSVTASIIGQVTSLHSAKVHQLPTTTFFPDQGTPPTRSNIPGRARFTLSPTVTTQPYFNTLPRARNPSHAAFNSQLPSHESTVLALRSISLNPEVAIPHQRPPLPGTMEYTGSESFDQNRSAKRDYTSASDLLLSNPGMDFSKYGLKPPRDLEGGMTAAEKYERRQQREMIARDREGDEVVFQRSSSGTATGRPSVRPPPVQQVRSGNRQQDALKKKEQKGMSTSALFDLLGATADGK